MRRIVGITLVMSVLLLCLCGCGERESKLQKTLEGTWKNDVMTVTFDFDKASYSGVALGMRFNKMLAVMSEKGNIMVFQSGVTEIVCQVLSDGSIILTKRGGIPMVLTKVRK